MRTADLAKLSLLFSRIERVHTLELARAATEVNAADDALSEHAMDSRQTAQHQRHAYVQADEQERHLLHAARLRAARTLPLLQSRQNTAEIRRQQALKTQQQSRLESERILAVLDRARVAARLAEGRRTQAQMDDRFAARAAWQQAQEDAEQR